MWLFLNKKRRHGFKTTSWQTGLCWLEDIAIGTRRAHVLARTSPWSGRSCACVVQSVVTKKSFTEGTYNCYWAVREVSSSSSDFPKLDPTSRGHFHELELKSIEIRTISWSTLCTWGAIGGCWIFIPWTETAWHGGGVHLLDSLKGEKCLLRHFWRAWGCYKWWKIPFVIIGPFFSSKSAASCRTRDSGYIRCVLHYSKMRLIYVRRRRRRRSMKGMKCGMKLCKMWRGVLLQSFTQPCNPLN